MFDLSCICRKHLYRAVSGGNPHDRFQFSLIGCPIYEAEAEIDLRTLNRQALIDAEYGGTGTQDPMPIEIESGDISLVPFNKGAQILKAKLASLKEGDITTITLDADDTLSFTHNDRVEVDGPEIAGALVLVTLETGTAKGDFEDGGSAKVSLGAKLTDCPLLLS